MESTFDKLITNDPANKLKFEMEYNEFIISELIREKIIKDNISVNDFSKEIGVPYTMVHKILKNRVSQVPYYTVVYILYSLGYRLNFTKIDSNNLELNNQ